MNITKKEKPFYRLGGKSKTHFLTNVGFAYKQKYNRRGGGGGGGGAGGGGGRRGGEVLMEIKL